MRRCGRRSREQAVEAEAGARGERSKRGERFERGALWKGQSLSGPASGSVQCLSAAPKPSSHSDTRSGLPAISAATSIFGVPGPRSLRYSQPWRQASRRAGLSSPIGQRSAQAFPRSSAPEDSTLEDSKLGGPTSGDPEFGDSMLEGSIFEGSMSGRADAWMGRCLEEQPDAVGVLLGSTSGSAVHRALSQARPPPGIPLPGCRRPALGVRLQIPRHPAVPAGHGQIRADRRAFPVERTFGAKLQAAFKPAADKARYVPFFWFGPEERAFSRSEGSRI
ncbi:hypothetical protein GGQ20_003189 [Salinibacter ruber]|nr:hypothetical protein [Salinibacter ruber]